MSGAIPRILLVETGTTCAKFLKQSGFKVVMAHRLSSGLKKLKAHHFDLVLLDLSLPDSRGIGTFTQFDKLLPQLPIVVLADEKEEKLAARTVQMGAQDYLLKSQLNSSLLLSSIRKAMDRNSGPGLHGSEGFLLQALMDNIPDAIYFKDLRSRYLMINRSKARKHGLSDPLEARGKSSKKSKPGRTAARPGRQPPRCLCATSPASWWAPSVFRATSPSASKRSRPWRRARICCGKKPARSRMS
jgi:DNA-binding NarL/FixJ family response regulator